MNKFLDFKKEEINTYLILLSAPLLLSIYYYYGYAKNFNLLFNFNLDEDLLDFYSHIYQFFSFFILMFIIPILFQKFVIKKPLNTIGLGLGDYKLGLKILLVIPIAIPVIFFAVSGADVRAEYPLAKVLHSRYDLILPYHIAYVLFYYVAWEFYFRGFLLFNLSEKFGIINSILIQTISSCLIHLGKPAGETIGAIFVGIIFGIIAYRTRSIWYVFILHILLGIFTDLFIIFYYGTV